MTLETTKLLGGIGAVLMLISPIGMHTGIVGLAGIILVMIALSRLAYHYNEPAIFNNALYGILAAIIGIAIFAIIMATTFFTLTQDLGIDFSNWAMLQNMRWEKMIDWNTFWPYLAVIILDFVMLFVFIIIAALFLRRSLALLGEKTGVHAFYTARMLILIGAILAIIAIGFIILWVALIFLAIAFFSIKTT